MIGAERKWKHPVTLNIFIIRNLIFVQKVVKRILENQAKGGVLAAVVQRAQGRN